MAETKTSSKRNLSPSFGEGSTPKKASVMVDHCNWAYGYFVPLEPKREVRFKPMSLKLVPEEKLEKGDVLDDEEIPYWRRMEPFQLNRASLGNFGKDKQFYRIFAKASKGRIILMYSNIICTCILAIYGVVTIFTIFQIRPWPKCWSTVTH